MNPDGRTPQWRREVRRARILVDLAALVCAAGAVAVAPRLAAVPLALLALVLLQTGADAAAELRGARRD